MAVRLGSTVEPKSEKPKTAKPKAEPKKGNKKTVKEK